MPTLAPSILCAAVLATELSGPILQLETGRHTAPIRRVDVDRAGARILTAAEDRTARVWRASDGSPVSILRPPVVDDGNVRAAALAPDGQSAVVGWAARDASGAHRAGHLYLFEVASGRLVRHLSSLSMAPNDAAYAPDGKRVAVALGDLKRGTGALLLLDASSGKKLAEHALTSPSYGVAFAHDGRFAVATMGGDIHVYNGAGTLVAQRKLPGGKPYGVAFSPKGRTLAVGFGDQDRVSLLDGRDLHPVASGSLGLTGVPGGLSAVAFDKRRQTLWAAGSVRAGQVTAAWKLNPRTAVVAGSHTLSTGTAMDLATLPDDGVVVVGHDARIERLNAAGAALWTLDSGAGQLQANQRSLRVSGDGRIVELSLGQDLQTGKDRLVSFSIDDRLRRDHDAGAPLHVGLEEPAFSRRGVAPSGVFHTSTPRLDGQLLRLDPLESARSVAVDPVGGSFVLAADWSLRRFDKKGSEMWRRPVPAPAWAVNIPASGQHAVVAYGDGTVRWHRLHDGVEVLALFLPPARDDWVLWRKDGTYDASAGGAALVGFTVTEVPPGGTTAEARFYPAAVLPELRQPDRIDDALHWAAPSATTAAARPDPSAAGLPPSVRIRSPGPDDRVPAEAKLRVEVLSPGGAPVLEVSGLVDGVPLPRSRGFRKPTGTVMELKVPISSPGSTVQIVARNRFGWSAPATVRLRSARRGSAATTALKPALYVLSVGVARYRDPTLHLQFAAKDAVDVGQAFAAQRGRLYRGVEVKTLTDAEATRTGILAGLEWLERQTTSRDTAVIFIAGHGLRDEQGEFLFLPVDSDPEKLRSTGLPFDEVRRTVERLAGRTLVFVDTCHAGAAMGGRRAVEVDGLVQDLLAAGPGAVVYASSTGRQVSVEDAAWGNGAFTEALVEGLSGKAAYGGDGRITTAMLDLWLTERVKQLTGGRQHPTTTKPDGVPDFPVALSP